MKFAQVVFPERLPRSSGFFDYQIPPDLEKKIHPGVLVIAPFRSSEKIGVVFCVQNKTTVPKEKLRHISEIITEQAVITSFQFTLIHWLRETSGSSYATILNVMVPQKPKRATYIPKKISQHLDKKKPSLGFQGYVIDNKQQEQTEIKKISNSKNVTVIIAPDIQRVLELKELLLDFHPITYTGDLNVSKKFATWQQVKQGQAKIIIGTRNALLLPFTEVQSIVVIDESDLTHQRTDQHPDIDTRTLALFVSELYKTKLIFIGSSLTVETFFQLRNFQSSIKRINRINKPSILIIDTNLFTQKKQSPILPDDLQSFLSDSNLHAFLLYNRKGYYRRIFCSECGWEPSCDVCGNAFISEKNVRGQLECRVCNTKKNIPITCPHCANPNIRFAYPGIEEMYRRLQSILPQNTVSLLTKDQQGNPNARITLGTVYALPYIHWNALQACVVLDTDISLNFPDFRSSEWFLHRLEKLYYLLPDSAKLFLLTKQPHHQTLQAFARHMPTTWYEKELRERKKLHYPPFAQFYKFNRQEKNLNVGERETATLLASIHSFLNQKDITGSVARLEPIPERSAKGFHFTLLLRIINPIQQTFLAKLYEISDSKWTIRQNPLDLFS